MVAQPVPGRWMLLAVLAPLMAACQPEPYWDGTPAARMLETDDRVREVAIGFDPAIRQTAAIDRLALGEAVRRARAAGQVSLDLVIPAGIEAAFDRDLARLIAGLGVAPDHVHHQVSSDLATNQAVARVHAIVVRSPVCAGVSLSAVDQTGARERRQGQQVLGCATAANLAAMIVDPRDLVGGNPPGPIDAERTVRPIDTLVSKSVGSSDGDAKTTKTTTASPSSSK